MCIAVTAFLHANYLSFIDEGAVDDMSLAAAYLSDAGRCRVRITVVSSESDVVDGLMKQRLP
jgi:hypothetical protein